MRTCEFCGAQKDSAVCRACGSAFYDDEKATVRIIPNNYDPQKLEERSLKFMTPFIKGTIQRMNTGAAR